MSVTVINLILTGREIGSVHMNSLAFEGRAQVAYSQVTNGGARKFAKSKGLPQKQAFPAKFAGKCERCSIDITAGQMIRHVSNGYVHDGCFWRVS